MSSYEILSQEAVRQLHQNFMKNIFESLSRQLPEAVRGDRIGEVSLLDAARDVVLAAIRRRQDPRLKEIGALMAAGPAALREMQREIEADAGPFTPGQLASIARAAAARKEPPAIAEAFGTQDRIYLKINGELAAQHENIITEHLKGRGYSVLDYKEGYATDAAGKQKFRIGKLLSGEPELLGIFATDPFRSSTPLVVISRNPDDIAAMSANRGWTSCMSPDGVDGMFNQFVPEDIRKGAVVAYLIKPGDPHIHDPLARIIIKPYREVYEGQELFDPEFADDHPLKAAFLKAMKKVSSFPLFPFAKPRERIFVPGHACGISTPGFEAAVRDFVEEKINRDKSGKFEMVWPLYLDEQPLHMQREGGKTEPLRQWTRG